jgi:hypothetical protein
MPEITVSEVGTIPDKRIKGIAAEVAATVELAAEKATLNAINPAQYPLSQRPTSLERIFSDRLASLTTVHKEKAAAQGGALLRRTAAARRSKYGRLAGVDLKGQTAVEDQVKAMAVPASLALTRDYVEGAQLTATSVATSRSSLLPGPILFASRPTKLEFRLHQLFCADEIGKYPWEEWGADEMYLGGSAIDATGVTTAIGRFKVGEFDDGDVFTYSTPKVMTKFDLTQGPQWPKTYYVVLALAEQDLGGFATYLNRLVDAIAEYVKAKLAGLAGGGPIGALIGLAVGYVVGKAIEWLKAWWGDDIFAPVTVKLEIPGYSSRFGGATDSANVVTRITGHNADYRLTYDWRLANFTAIPVARN